jgi:hypothetical protein
MGLAIAGVSEFSVGARELVAQERARIAARCGLTPEAVQTSNAPAAVAARYEWLRVVRDTWALSASATGRLCGVDHSTVLQASRVGAS